MAKSGLTPKQKLFVQEYLKDFNATKSAKRAGFKEKSAYQTGYELLKKPEIKASIDRLKQEICDRNNLTLDWIVQRYMAIADTSLTQVFDTETGEVCPEINHFQRLAISGFKKTETQFGDDGMKQTKEIRMENKQSALKALAEYKGGLNESGGESGEDSESILERLLERSKKRKKPK